MASITSLSGLNSTSSMYSRTNAITGLASGLDTEALIEGAVASFQTKITSLQQKQTKLGWEQEAYRSIINKLVSFSEKYTSYTSGTNLLSANFFDSAIKTISNGKNADKVSASGKTSSMVQLNSVSQLATAARYATSGNLKSSSVAGDSFEIDGEVSVSKLSGSMTLGYGGKTIKLSFDEGDVFESAEKMAAAINKNLEDKTISFDGGTQAAASERIRAVAEGDTIKFETVKENDGNGVWIDSASDSVKSALGITIGNNDDKSVKSFTFNSDAVTEKKDMVSYLNEKGFTIVLDGVSKTIKGPSEDELGSDWAALDEKAKSKLYIEKLQDKINEAFGSDALTVSDAEPDVPGITLQFKAADETSKFQVTSGAEKALKMEGGLTSYVNTNQKLGSLIDGDWDDSWRVTVSGTVTEDPKTEDGVQYGKDADGNRVKKDGDSWYRVDAEGEYLYDFKVNGKSVATVSKDTTLSELINKINNNEDSDITVAYSSFTGKFTFEAKETGAKGEVDFGDDGLAAAMFGFKRDNGIKAKELLGYETLKGEEFSMQLEDGTEVSFTFKGENGTMEDVLGRINGALQSKNANLTASYASDGSLVVTDGETGETLDVTYGEGVAQDLFAAVTEKYGYYTQGQDAKFNVTVNGETRELTRSSNSIEIDGMTLTLKGTFEKDTEAVTFTTSADADKIVEVVKEMVNDYNAMATEIKKAYSTMPLENSSGKPYEPLTDADMADMSESAIKAYEEKAKTGLLFGDRDLANLYNGLRDALNVLGVTGNDAQALGITTSYSDGMTTLAFDENALRKSLEEDPDKVKDVFTRSTKNGAATDGLMQGLKTQLDRYAATTGATKGILIQKAGSTLAPTSIYQNTIQTKMNEVEDEIARWQDKLEDRVDYYTSKFTALEVLISQMNNQSSMLMGLGGGY